MAAAGCAWACSSTKRVGSNTVPHRRGSFHCSGCCAVGTIRNEVLAKADRAVRNAVSPLMKAEPKHEPIVRPVVRQNHSAMLCEQRTAIATSVGVSRVHMVEQVPKGVAKKESTQPRLDSNSCTSKVQKRDFLDRL